MRYLSDHYVLRATAAILALLGLGLLLSHVAHHAPDEHTCYLCQAFSSLAMPLSLFVPSFIALIFLYWLSFAEGQFVRSILQEDHSPRSPPACTP
jgi:hypothetical protein